MRLLISLTILLSLIGCSRKQAGLSNISIQMPNLQGKVGSLGATLPAGRVACYGVSIRGSGITGVPANACHPELGMTLGFVAAGASLQAQVLKGSDRIFDVYLYLQPTGQNTPCPTMGGFSSLSPDNLYLIGNLPNVNLAKETETITIPITFNGVATNLYSQNSYPTSCLPPPISNVRGYQISSVESLATGAGYKLRGRVGRVVSGDELTGGSLKLRINK
jgi:hypothetical protein